MVVPVDLSDPENMMLIAGNLHAFIKRGIPVRFGLVPLSSSPESVAQLKVAHYLFDAYGLDSLVKYFEAVCSHPCIPSILCDIDVEVVCY